MAKATWQMTLAEYVDSLKGVRIKKTTGLSRSGQLHSHHQTEVAIAIQTGSPVPRKVVIEFRRTSPALAYKLLDLPEGKYRPKVARFR